MVKVPYLDYPVVPQKLPDQPEAAVTNDIPTDDLRHSQEINKHLKDEVSVKTMVKVPYLDYPVVPQKLPDQPEAAVTNDIPTDDLRHSQEINKHLKHEVSVKTMVKVPYLDYPVVPQKLPDQPEAPIPNDIQADDLHHSEEINKHLKNEVSKTMVKVPDLDYPVVPQK